MSTSFAFFLNSLAKVSLSKSLCFYTSMDNASDSGNNSLEELSQLYFLRLAVIEILKKPQFSFTSFFFSRYIPFRILAALQLFIICLFTFILKTSFKLSAPNLIRMPSATMRKATSVFSDWLIFSATLFTLKPLSTVAYREKE